MREKVRKIKRDCGTDRKNQSLHDISFKLIKNMAEIREPDLIDAGQKNSTKDIYVLIYIVNVVITVWLLLLSINNTDASLETRRSLIRKYLTIRMQVIR